MPHLILTVLSTISAPYIYYKIRNKLKQPTSVNQFKKILVINIVSFFIILLHSSFFMFTNVYGAQVQQAFTNERGMAFLAAALVTGMCTIGTGIATGQAASAALGAISENEGLMGKALIFVALAEGIAIYGLLISFMILAQV